MIYLLPIYSQLKPQRFPFSSRCGNADSDPHTIFDKYYVAVKNMRGEYDTARAAAATGLTDSSSNSFDVDEDFEMWDVPSVSSLSELMLRRIKIYLTGSSPSCLKRSRRRYSSS